MAKYDANKDGTHELSRHLMFSAGLCKLIVFQAYVDSWNPACFLCIPTGTSIFSASGIGHDFWRTP